MTVVPGKLKWGFAGWSRGAQIGAAGQQLARRLDVAVKLATPFVDYLDQTGLGDHPAMVRMFHRISQAIGEDSLIEGAPDAPLTTPRTAGGTPLLSFPSMEKG